MCVNGYLTMCFEICFLSVETDIQRMRDTVGREKAVGEIKTHHQSHPGKNKNFPSLIIYGLCLLWDLINYESLMITVTVC